MILFMKKTKLLSALAVAAVMLPAATSCNDKNDEPVVSPSEWALPIADFGKTIDEVSASETARGFRVVKTDSIHLRAVKNIKNAQVSITYCFDPDTKTYRYAKGTYAGEDELKALTERLAADGYADEGEKNGVKVYNQSSDNAHVALEEGSSEFYMLPGASNDTFSWGRLNDLSDAAQAGLAVPYLGHYAPVELVELMEQYCGNTLDSASSKIDNGVYVFKAQNGSKHTSVRYWFDVATKSKLEEAAVYYTLENRPSTAEVDTCLSRTGFKYTSMKDASDGSMIYYNYSEKCVAYVAMDKPDGATSSFMPSIHYAYNDLSGQVPPETVDFPAPLIDFGTMTLNEAVEQYKKQSYFTGTTDDGFGGLLGLIVTTNSKDFPQILLMDDGGKYAAALVIANESKMLRSPYIKDWLTAKGYTYNEKVSILPTYIRSDKKVMAQFDIDGSITGFPCVAFQPNEFNAAPSLLGKLKQAKQLKR